ncbi:hypothetical protein N9847_01625 [bacterium]|nr:hypothetical protein [bacterium]
MSNRFQTLQTPYIVGWVFSLTLSLTSWTSPLAGEAFFHNIVALGCSAEQEPNPRLKNKRWYKDKK